MVCTSAFGMGVHLPDIDVVIEVGPPSSLEELVQMFGRAGRDGRNAEGMFDQVTMTSLLYFLCALILEVSQK